MTIQGSGRLGCSRLFMMNTLALLMVSGAVMAQNAMEPYQEYDKRIRTSEQVGPLSAHISCNSLIGRVFFHGAKNYPSFCPSIATLSGPSGSGRTRPVAHAGQYRMAMQWTRHAWHTGEWHIPTDPYRGGCHDTTGAQGNRSRQQRRQSRHGSIQLTVIQYYQLVIYPCRNTKAKGTKK